MHLIQSAFNNASVSEIALRKPYELLLDNNNNQVPQTNRWHQQYIEQFEALGYLNWDYNLIKEVNNRNHTNETYGNRFNASINYRPIDGLKLSSSLLYESINGYDRELNNENVFSTANTINQYTLYDPATGLLDHQFPTGSILYESYSPMTTYTFRNIVSYNKNFGENHKIYAIIGTEMRQIYSTSMSSTHVGYDEESLEYSNLYLTGGVENFYGIVSNFQNNTYRTDYGDIKNRHLSYFTNMGYTLMNKYTFTASARVDKTNLFGIDKRFRNNPLWSVGFKWNMVKEDFLPDFVNRLDLRTSFGYNGNVDKGAKSFATATYSTNIRNERFLTMNSPKNNDLSFEKTRIYNLGADFSLWQNRLTGSFDMFLKNSGDLLSYVATDPTTGWSQIYSNYASVTNKGFEIELNSKVYKSSNLSITLGGNFSFVKNIVSKVESPRILAKYYISGGSGAARVGIPISSLYSFRTAGIDTNGEYLTYTAADSVVIGRDSYTLEYDDLVYSGQTDPKYFGGISASIRYKKFRFNTSLAYKGGHVSRMPIPNYGAAAYGNNTHESISNAWRIPGDESKPGVLPAMLGPLTGETAWKRQNA